MLEIKNLTKRYDETIIKNLNIILPSTGSVSYTHLDVYKRQVTSN